MSPIGLMLETRPPAEHEADQPSLVAVMEALVDCAQTCAMCADACLDEQSVADLRRCIVLNLDCADVCNATFAVIARRTSKDIVLTRALVQACIEACRACGAECREHGEHMAHCAICAEACDRCREACERFLDAMERTTAGRTAA
jgi:hypothetical protein